MNRTRRRRRRKKTRRRRTRGGFKFKRPKLKMPKFKKPKLLGKVADFGKKGLSKVGSVGKKGLGAVGRGVGKMGKMAMGSPMGMMAGLGGLGAAGALLASMGGIPMGQFSKIAKIGGMMVAPLLLLGSFLKPGAKFVYQGLKQVVTVAIKSGKGGFTFIINMVGMPIKALMALLGNIPMLMAGIGGFAGIAMLVSKGYLGWIARTWKWIADGWASAPLFTWCEKREDGTCRCPQILRIKKEGGKAQIVIEDQKQKSSAEGKGCFMNRQCPSGLICKKKHAWSPRGKCTQGGTLPTAVAQPIVTPPSPIVMPPSPIVTPPSPMVSPPPIIEPGAPLVSNQPIKMAGGGKLREMWKLEGETTDNGIKFKAKKMKSRRRTRRKHGSARSRK